MLTEANFVRGLMQTYTGRMIQLEDFKAEDIKIEDIAHSLSLQCRYCGHTSYHYSIAQHSVLVSYMVPEHIAKQALLHDTTEAYLVDIPSHLKKLVAFEPYMVLEDKVWKVISEYYNVDYELDPILKVADKGILWWESNVLMRDRQGDLNPYWERYREAAENFQFVPIESIHPLAAEIKFLQRAKELGIEC